MLTSLAIVGALRAMDVKPDPARLKSTIDKLVTWNTRNTNTPELFEVADWVAGEMKKIPGLQVETMRYQIHADGRRVPEDKDVVQVIGVLPGETDERIMVGGHMDTINLKGDIYKGKAPGANDDGSGVALTLEAARLFATKKWRHTMVFVVFSGEEQGLFGSYALAERAKKENWKIKAFFNNDTVGSSMKPNGQTDRKSIRVFSTDPLAKPATESRELARLIEFANRKNSVKVKLILRSDRFGRGGDHTPFNLQGFNAVRFTELFENYDHQHTPNDSADFVDYKYLAGVVQANLNAMMPLANSGDAPVDVRVKRVLDDNVTLSWKGQPGVKYDVFWRETSDATWREKISAGAVTNFVVKGSSKDDNVFAVASEGGIPVEAK